MIEQKKNNFYKKEKETQEKKTIQEKSMKAGGGDTLEWAILNFLSTVSSSCPPRPKIEFAERKIVFFSIRTARRLFFGFGVCMDD